MSSQLPFDPPDDDSELFRRLMRELEEPAGRHPLFRNPVYPWLAVNQDEIVEEALRRVHEGTMPPEEREARERAEKQYEGDNRTRWDTITRTAEEIFLRARTDHVRLIGQKLERLRYSLDIRPYLQAAQSIVGPLHPEVPMEGVEPAYQYHGSVFFRPRQSTPILRGIFDRAYEDVGAQVITIDCYQSPYIPLEDQLFYDGSRIRDATCPTLVAITAFPAERDTLLYLLDTDSLYQETVAKIKEYTFLFPGTATVVVETNLPMPLSMPLLDDRQCQPFCLEGPAN